MYYLESTENQLPAPKFGKEQTVTFLGGIGTVKNYQPNASTWTYTISMKMGPEPNFGRIGAETTILLVEEEIQGIV